MRSDIEQHDPMSRRSKCSVKCRYETYDNNETDICQQYDCVGCFLRGDHGVRINETQTSPGLSKDRQVREKEVSSS